MSNLQLWGEGLSQEDIQTLVEGAKPVDVKIDDVKLSIVHIVLGFVLCFIMPFLLHALSVHAAVIFDKPLYHYSAYAIVLSSLSCVFSFFYIYLNCSLKVKLK